MDRHRDRRLRRPRGARPGGGHPAEEDDLISDDTTENRSAGRRNARPTGRRPGNPDTREAVLSAARAQFGDKGFDGATIRGIATQAGVDPALVHHYFGSKDKLFLAAIQAPEDPSRILPAVLAGGPENLGENMVRTLVRVWDGPMRPAALALVRSAMSNEWTAKLLREFLVTQVLRRILATLDLPDAERDARGSLAASQLIGLVMARYVLRVEPLASATPDVLAAAIGPTLQRYLTGDVQLPG